MNAAGKFSVGVDSLSSDATCAGVSATSSAGEVLLELIQAPRADDRRGDTRPALHPRERDRRRVGAQFLGDRDQLVDDRVAGSFRYAVTRSPRSASWSSRSRACTCRRARRRAAATTA